MTKELHDSIYTEVNWPDVYRKYAELSEHFGDKIIKSILEDGDERRLFSTLAMEPKESVFPITTYSVNPLDPTGDKVAHVTNVPMREMLNSEYLPEEKNENLMTKLRTDAVVGNIEV